MDCLSLAVSPDRLFLCKRCGLSIVEAKCPYIVRSEKIYVKDAILTDSTSLMISMENPLETLPQIFYPNASRNMGFCCLSWVFHCLDTRWPPAPFYERVEPDMEFALNFVNSVTLFYKSFVLPCLLGYRDIFDCPKCNKAILEEDEISESAKGKVFAVTLAALGAFAMC